MLIVNKGCVTHDGTIYHKGEALPEMKGPHQLRLLDLGVCIEGDAPKIEEAEKEVSNSPDGLNLDFNPEDAIQDKK